MARTHYQLIGKENSSDKYCVKFEDFSRIFRKNQQMPVLSRALFKFQDFLGPVGTPIKLTKGTDAYLGPSQTPMMGLFAKISCYIKISFHPIDSYMLKDGNTNFKIMC